MNSKTSELIKNTIIIFFGRFCTQFISLILLLIYTFYLSTEEYGIIDLIQNYILLLVPIISLRLDSAFFRFIIDIRNNEKEKTKIITNGLITTGILLVIFTIIYWVVNMFVTIPYNIFVYLNICAVILSNIFMQISRGTGDNIGYSISCIIVAILNIVCTIVLFKLFEMKGVAILISATISNFACFIFIFFRSKIFKYIEIGEKAKDIVYKMLKYSLPMIPDGLSWWIVGVSDRTIINVLMGASYNGVYAVSSKFSNILSSIFSIINMSWQESAAIYINDKDRDSFFSKIFNNLMFITISICILLMSVMFIIFKFFIDNTYVEAYNYIPILLIANIVNALTILQGGVLIAKMNSKDAAKTTMIGAVINIVLNALFISKFGLYMAALSTLISYVVIAIIRQVKIKKYVNISFEINKFIYLIFILVITTIIYYMDSTILKMLYLIIVTVILSIFNKEYIIRLLLLIKKKINNKNINYKTEEMK